MLGIFQQLPSIAINQNLRKLNEIRFPFVRNSGSVTPIKFSVRPGATKGITLKVLNATEGNFYSNAAGTALIGDGKSVIANVPGDYVFYFRGLTNGTLQMLNADEVGSYGVGSDWGGDNGFISDINAVQIVDFDITQLGVSVHSNRFNFNNHFVKGSIDWLQYCNNVSLIVFSAGGNGGFLKGSLASISHLTMLISLRIEQLEIFDYKYIPVFTAGNGINLENGVKTTGQVRHTGTSAAPAYPAQSINVFRLDGQTPTPAAEVDKILINLSSAGNGASMLTIYGTRTAASDAAVASLTAKGYTVNLI